MKRPSAKGRAGGEREPRFAAIRRKEAALVDEVGGLDLKALQAENLLSANGKTGVSLDFPIGQTCQPTALCAATCYASKPGATAAWPKSLRKRVRNLAFFRRQESKKAIARLSSDFARKRRFWAKRGVKLDFLRVNGSGDLFPEIVAVLNGFARLHPEVRVWIVTRRFDLAAAIEPLANVFLQLSLDSTTPPNLEAGARELVAKNARAYLSFLRTKADDDTRGAAIVFNEKATAGLPFKSRTDCPVDAGRLSLGNERGVGGTACSKCRKCFVDTTLARQRDDRQVSPVAPPARVDGGVRVQRDDAPLVTTDERGRRHLAVTHDARWPAEKLQAPVRRRRDAAVKGRARPRGTQEARQTRNELGLAARSKRGARG